MDRWYKSSIKRHRKSSDFRKCTNSRMGISFQLLAKNNYVGHSKFSYQLLAKVRIYTNAAGHSKKLHQVTNVGQSQILHQCRTLMLGFSNQTKTYAPHLITTSKNCPNSNRRSRQKDLLEDLGGELGSHLLCSRGWRLELVRWRSRIGWRLELIWRRSRSSSRKQGIVLC
jgi:hypothetical protein